MIVATDKTDRFAYAVHVSQTGQWSLVRVTRNRGSRRTFGLDRDRRHDRLFLSPRDQRTVGIEGLQAVERMARAIWPRSR